MPYYVYMISNDRLNALYIGMTNNLYTRIHQHKEEEGSKFTSKYHCIRLLYYEQYENVRHAIEREKQLKNWKRAWKEELIKTINPEKKDLMEEFY